MQICCQTRTVALTQTTEWNILIDIRQQEEPNIDK